MEFIDLGKMNIPAVKPKKGVDYYTEDEINEVVEEVFGRVNTEVEKAENVRQDNENLRLESETSREDAEKTRTQQEIARVASESSREEREIERISAETIRTESEEIRQQQEIARETGFDEKMTEVDNAINQIEYMTKAIEIIDWSELVEEAENSVGVYIDHNSLVKYDNKIYIMNGETHEFSLPERGQGNSSNIYITPDQSEFFTEFKMIDYINYNDEYWEYIHKPKYFFSTNEDVENLQTEQEELKEKVNILESENTVQNERISELERDNATNKAGIEELESTIGDINTVLDQINGEII